MSSFKLEKGGSAKEQATGAGALILILGLVVTVVWHPIGLLLALIGIIALVAGSFASH